MGPPETAQEDDPAVTGSGEESREATSLEDLSFVGASTAATLSAADISVEDVDEKTVSYRELVEAGVNPGVAGKIRREHSLHWTHDEEAFDLDRRSKNVRGLREGEREWVASTEGTELEVSTDRPASQNDDSDGSQDVDGWYDGNGDRIGTNEVTGTAMDGDAADDELAGDGEDPFSAEAAWRERASSPSVATVGPVPADAAEALETVGVETVRQLATANVDRLATELGLDRDDLDYWQALAAQRIE
ncbi:hypothetical protein L593_13020 [Salinarchaeum sp. Harcht-Bsk1]|uniref:DUF7409 domain-containing protein n=1 Tax=Salinarchaeum sp. Harcht-Bsk1 TaxID=1333523 RepID=UPI0003424402|nr:hypothetical protein [Salinarchaeum sp. Harcht-Bsk1]AGN02543.1 hypothetical protein L593_13020 [Salinarchaeum sp. Harcht-Bsk1]